MDVYEKYLMIRINEQLQQIENAVDEVKDKERLSDKDHLLILLW